VSIPRFEPRKKSGFPMLVAKNGNWCLWKDCERFIKLAYDMYSIGLHHFDNPVKLKSDEAIKQMMEKFHEFVEDDDKAKCNGGE